MGDPIVNVRVEVPLGGFVKRRPDGAVDYVSALPCPFNYGCAPGLPGGDGDPQDVVLLGPRRPRGWEQPARVWAVVRFVDAGDTDDKWVCADHAPSAGERWRVLAFFRLFAVAKRALNRLRGKAGDTRLVGWEAR